MSHVVANKEKKVQIIGCTASGKPRIVSDGYTYLFDKRNVKNTLNFWRCTHKSYCRVRIHSDVHTDVIVATMGSHSHPRDNVPQVPLDDPEEPDENIFAVAESEPKNEGELLDDELLGIGSAPSQQSFSWASYSEATLPASSNDCGRRFLHEDILQRKGSLRAKNLTLERTVDEDELFGQTVTVKLRKISDKTGKERLKMKILQCFADYSRKHRETEVIQIAD